MKNYIKIILVLLLTALILLSCDSNDDGFYNEKYVNIPNLVHIEGQTIYHVGDFLYVNSDFSRYLNEPGQTTPLDIFATTNGATQFDFTYVVEKKIADNQWEVVQIATNELDIQAGAAESEFFVLAHATYSPATQAYSYRAGIPLESTGEYRLSFGINSQSVDTVELRSASVGNSLFLNINSGLQDLNVGEYYLFNVN